MEVKTFKAQYELIEFNHYMDYNDGKPISILDIVVESDSVDFVKDELSNLFVINTENDSYTFSNYEVTECYEIGGRLIRVICVK